MADMLKFRKGTLAQINAADKVAGTIYIAKDEKAMYVDISDNERIRIGDLIRVSSVDKIEPPFSTTSLYYVEDQNALLGYDGTEWKQINGTEVLEDRLDTVEGTVAGHTSDIKNLSDYVGTFTHATAKTVVEYIEARTSGIATSENLQALTNRVTTAEGKITTIEGNITTINGDITSINDEISGHESRITDLEAASAKYAEKTYVDNTFAKVNDVYTKTQVYTQTEADSKISAAVKVEADRAKEQEQALVQTVTGHTSILNVLDGDGEGSVADAKKAGTDAAAALNTYKNEHKSDYTNTQIDAAIKVAKDAADAAQGTATSAQNQAQANKAAIEILNGTDKEEGSVAKAIADAKAALSAEIDADIRSANALEYAGTISSTVSLPITAKNGAVYVVEEAVDDYFAGDLVIAQGDEDENGLIPENKITWKRVKTGYDASLEQSILTEGNAIKLSSLSGKDNGAITFVADTSAAKVTVENNTVTIGIHWEDFK